VRSQAARPLGRQDSQRSVQGYYPQQLTCS
jgi:hypothetical protein